MPPHDPDSLPDWPDNGLTSLFATDRPAPARKMYKVDDLDAPGPRLMRALRLSGKDLDTNREGKLSPRQRDDLEAELMRRTIWQVLLTVFAIFFTIGISAPFFMPHETFTDLALRLIVLALTIFCAVCFWGFTVAGQQIRVLYEDIHRGEVDAIRGEIKLGAPHWNYYHVFVGEKRLFVSQAVHESLIENELYILYYTPLSESTVAAEYVHPTFETEPGSSLEALYEDK